MHEFIYRITFIINFMFVILFYPAGINQFVLLSIPIEVIHDKIESEVANVVASKINLGCETNCGIRQHIKMYL